MRRNPVELNKDCILNLGEKNYENLVEALTNGVINTAVDSPYNSKLSLSQSLSTFPSLSKSDTYKIEEPESFDNSKCDTAD